MAAQDLQLPFEMPPNGELTPAQVQANFDYLLQFFKGKFQIDDTTGVITQPLQPSFLATASGAQTITGTNAPLENYSITFSTEVYDRASNYDGSTIFTAPRDGLYLFSGFLRVVSTTGTFVYTIKINTSNRNYALGNETLAVGVSRNHPFTVIADMEEGDTAKIQMTLSLETDTAGITDGYFSCSLLN